MTTTAQQLMTAEEFFDWVHRPENSDRSFELVRGIPVESPLSGELHGFVAANCTRILGNYNRQRNRGYVCCNGTGIIWERNPDTVLGPDVFYCDEQLTYDELNPKYSERVPQVVVEVLSHNDRISKVNERIEQFLCWGVAMGWLVAPEDRTVTVYRPGRHHQILEGEQELDGEDVLSGFRCHIAEFFWVAGQKKNPA